MITREYIDQQLAKKAEKLKDECDKPYCRAKPGQECRTPNGHRTHHKTRGRVAAVKRPHRLSDAQAERIEWAAEQGTFEAPDQYATLRGDAKRRACADALERAGLVVQVGTTGYGWRIFALTAAGWAAYHESPLVIRRFDESRHDETCPCRKQTAFDQVAEVNNRPEFAAAKSELQARHEEARRALLANAALHDVSGQARGVSVGAKVLDLTAKLAARNGSTPRGAA